eukprot:366095-Chlamydomonas_euryale.AAC.25
MQSSFSRALAYLVLHPTLPAGSCTQPCLLGPAPSLGPPRPRMQAVVRTCQTHIAQSHGTFADGSCASSRALAYLVLKPTSTTPGPERRLWLEHAMHTSRAAMARLPHTRHAPVASVGVCRAQHNARSGVPSRTAAAAAAGNQAALAAVVNYAAERWLLGTPHYLIDAVTAASDVLSAGAMATFLAAAAFLAVAMAIFLAAAAFLAVAMCIFLAATAFLTAAAGAEHRPSGGLQRSCDTAKRVLRHTRRSDAGRVPCNCQLHEHMKVWELTGQEEARKKPGRWWQ